MDGLGIAIALGAMLAVWLLVLLRIDSEFRFAADVAARTTATLARTLDSEVAGRIGALDTVLRYGQALYAADPAAFSIPAWIGVERDPDIVQAGLIAPDGSLQATLTGPPATPVMLGDRPRIAKLLAEPRPDRLAIGTPLVGRTTEREAIHLARPLFDPAGQFTGILFVSVAAERFSRLYHRLELPDVVIALIGQDGFARAQVPAPAGLPGMRAPEALLATLRQGPEEVTRRGTGMPDAVDRIATLRRVEGFPLVVSVGLSTDAAFADARTARMETVGFGAVLTVLIGAVALGAHAMRRRDRRGRAQLEATLAHLGQGVLMIDPAGRIAVANGQVNALLGLPAGLVVPGRPIGDIVAWQEQSGEFGGGPAPRTHVDGFRGPGKPPLVRTRTRPDGTILEIRTAYVGDGSHVRTFTDITALRRSAEALADARDRALAAEAALAAALENVPHGVALFDADGRLLLANAAAAELNALPPELTRPGTPLEAIYRHQRETGEIDAAFEARQRAALERLRGRRDWPPYERVKPDGRVVEARTTFLADGRMIRTYTDVTVRHEALRAQEAAKEKALAAQATLAAAFEAAPLGIVLIGTDQRLQVINTMAAQLLELPTALARAGTPVRDILDMQIARGDFEATPEAFEAAVAITGGPAEAIPSYERRTRNQRVLDIRSRALPDGRIVRTFTDVTARHAAMQAQEAALRSRTEFLAVVSHELRTPLHAVIGFADLLLARKPRPDQAEDLRMIAAAGRQLLTLVDDILDVTRLERGRVTLRQETFDLRATLETLGALIAPRAAAKGLTFELRIDPAVPGPAVGDQDRVRQVVLKLLDNAVKFTEAGRITLTAELRAESDTGWDLHLAVADTGIGIPPGEEERLFEPFAQADSSNARRFGGLGLGLAISRLLLESMGGGIAVESAPGRGSIFRVSLTLRRPSATPPAPATPPLHVLVAEDVAVNRAVALALLRLLGHEADAVEDGAAALAAVRARTYDLVLMDVMMPGMDGIAAARAIRALPEAKARVPIIAVTAHGSAEMEQACRQAGMDHFESKPLQAERLRRAITAVRASRAARSIPAPTVPHEDAPGL